MVQELFEILCLESQVFWKMDNMPFPFRTARNYSKFNVICKTHLTLIGKSWKTHPEIFLKFSFSGSSHRPFYWKTHPFEFFDWNHIWYVTIGLDEFSSKTACVTPQNSPIDDWISFPEQRSSSRPGFSKNWITHDFWWMSFPVKPSQKCPRNLPIRVNNGKFQYL